MRLFAFLGLKQKVSHVDIAKNQPGKAAFLDPERVHKGRRPGVLVVQVNLDPKRSAFCGRTARRAISNSVSLCRGS